MRTDNFNDDLRLTQPLIEQIRLFPSVVTLFSYCYVALNMSFSLYLCSTKVELHHLVVFFFPTK